jgi:hypothetical protein
MAKRKDECLFCKSRNCHTRIVRLEKPQYDEVACNVHIFELEEHSDIVLGSKNGLMRWHMSGTSRHKRGEPTPSYYGEYVVLDKEGSVENDG